MNALSLGAWYSLDRTVDELRARKPGCLGNAVAIHDAVLDAWERWPAADKLTHIYRSLDIYAQEVVRYKGGNIIKLHTI